MKQGQYRDCQSQNLISKTDALLFLGVGEVLIKVRPQGVTHGLSQIRRTYDLDTRPVALNVHQ
jgi:hypothetical protein